MTPMISARTPDWSREAPRRFWDPGRRFLAALRSYQRNRSRRGLGRLVARYASLRARFWSVIIQSEIPLNTDIGGGLLLPHPNGIVIHPKARIGPNCLVFHQVTIGMNGRGGVPRIGGHVDIGAGAKIIGNVVIGDHAVIGANAVVTRDVPRGGVVVGAPARLVRTLALDEDRGDADRSHDALASLRSAARTSRSA